MLTDYHIKLTKPSIPGHRASLTTRRLITCSHVAPVIPLLPTGPLTPFTPVEPRAPVAPRVQHRGYE